MDTITDNISCSATTTMLPGSQLSQERYIPQKETDDGKHIKMEIHQWFRKAAILPLSPTLSVQRYFLQCPQRIAIPHWLLLWRPLHFQIHLATGPLSRCRYPAGPAEWKAVSYAYLLVFCRVFELRLWQEIWSAVPYIKSIGQIQMGFLTVEQESLKLCWPQLGLPASLLCVYRFR